MGRGEEAGTRRRILVGYLISRDVGGEALGIDKVSTDSLRSHCTGPDQSHDD